jgi:hypothetical protein
VFPIVGTAFLGYVLWKQVYPVPAHPYNLFPYIDLAWLVVGCVYLFSRPSIVERARHDVEALRADAHVVTAGPYIHAGDVEVVGPVTAAEEADARVL